MHACMNASSSITLANSTPILLIGNIISYLPTRISNSTPILLIGNIISYLPTRISMTTIIVVTDTLNDLHSPKVHSSETSTGLGLGHKLCSGSSVSNNDHIISVYDGGCTIFAASMPRGIQLDQIRMVAAEVLGTFMLMFCVCGIISVTQILGTQSVGLLEYAVTGGLTITTVIFCVGPISGAHVNPAFTLAFATFGHFSWFKVPFYITAQLVGSIFATYVAECVYGVKPELVLTVPLRSISSAFWSEFIGTYMIMLLAASLLYNCKTIGHLSGIVVGLGIGLAVMLTGPVSGGSLNPARSLGPAIISGKYTHIWIYIVAPCAGAMSGGMTYRLLRLHDDHHPATSNVVVSSSLPSDDDDKCFS